MAKIKEKGKNIEPKDMSIEPGTLTLLNKKVADGNDLYYLIPIDSNSIITKEKQQELGQKIKDSVILTGDGRLNISAKGLPPLLKTNDKTIKNKIINEVSDKDKRIIDDELYIAEAGATSLIINARDHADSKEKEETCQKTLDNLNEMGKTDKVQSQRAKAREIIEKEDKKNKKEALKQAKEDALTGESLKKSVVHHDKAKAVYCPEEYLIKENYKVINEENHIEGHSSGILDDPNTSWEEKQKKFKEHKSK